MTIEIRILPLSSCSGFPPPVLGQALGLCGDMQIYRCTSVIRLLLVYGLTAVTCSDDLQLLLLALLSCNVFTTDRLLDFDQLAEQSIPGCQIDTYTVMLEMFRKEK